MTVFLRDAFLSDIEVSVCVRACVHVCVCVCSEVYLYNMYPAEITAAANVNNRTRLHLL